MSNAAAVIVFVVAIAPICGLLFWLQSRAEKKSRADAAAASEAFQKRLANPDLKGLERRIGFSLPASFRALYEDRQLINSEDLLIGVPNPWEQSNECYIAWFLPADGESSLESRPDFPGLFAFANNGAGDEFLVDLRQPDPEVIYYLHETGEVKAIGARLSAFLAAPRRAQPEE